ncbi:nucleotidyltransferase family protein [Algihabitans sp.]|uniref:nucleotidyltransferase family protein n=1 Tax=Algihabitans sp. TaxID=2821514 RepID=UPI003BA906F7
MTLTRAMVLAAGRGERMRPLTETTPKPLIAVHGVPMIDRILARLAAARIEKAVVNLHHLGGKLRSHLSDCPAPPLVFSDEPELLETGGGVKKALPELGPAPFFVCNGDVVWLDGYQPTLERLRSYWDPERMDVLLLLQPSPVAVGYDGPGDFVMDPQGRLRRRREREIAPFTFAGVQVLKPELFATTPDGPFSLNLIYDRAIERERLYGLRHDGAWYHVGRPEDLERAELELRSELGGGREERMAAQE